MKIEWDEKIKKPVMIFEEIDFVNANEILLTIQSPGWKVLTGYFNSSREIVMEKGKEAAKLKMKRDLCDNLFAFLDGFDTCMRLPQQIVRQAETMKEAIEKSKNRGEDNANEFND